MLDDHTPNRTVSFLTETHRSPSGEDIRVIIRRTGDHRLRLVELEGLSKTKSQEQEIRDEIELFYLPEERDVAYEVLKREVRKCREQILSERYGRRLLEASIVVT